MTRARALKHAIRARAAKTGERYTTARRHVLSTLNAVEPTTSTAAASQRVAAQTTGKRSPGISEEKIIQKTGHGFDHWFAVLDRFGAVQKGHTAAARHLSHDHGVNGWHSQSITVAYERARGVRSVNQRCDGAFEVSVSKIVRGTVPAVIRVLSSAARRARLKTSDAELLPALEKALAGAKSQGFVIRTDGLGRFRYQWAGTTVQFHLTPKPANKVSIVVTNMKLTDARMVEQRRAAWRELLHSLADFTA